MAAGDPNDNVVGFDVSQATEAITKLQSKLTDYNSLVEQITNSQAGFNREGNITVLTFQTIDSQGQKVSRTIRQIEGDWIATKAAIKGAGDAQEDLTKKMLEAARTGSLLDQQLKQDAKGRYRDIETGKFASKARIDAIRAQEDEVIRILLVKKEEEDAILRGTSRLPDSSPAAQSALMSQLTTSKTQFEQAQAKQREVNDLMIRGEQARKALARENLENLAAEERERVAIYNKEVTDARQNQAQLLEIQNRRIIELKSHIRATDFGSNLMQGVDLGRASPAEALAVTKSVGAMMREIESGSISSERALHVLQATMAKTGEVFQGSELKVAQSAVGYQKAIEGIGKSADQISNLDKVNKKATESIVISWRSVIRFLEVRILYQIFFSLGNAFKNATNEAQEFQIRISEIRTISQDAQLTTKQWTNEIRRLSDAFGAPAAQVAEGLYETISNQIAKGADAARFLEKAMKFAAVSVATTDEAVNLLSATLNSFNLSSAETERVSAILFRTIDLGRVRAGEMANTFGRVGALTHTMGVSLEETSAAIATLTINGIKYNEAFTLINNIMLKLIKPTDQMKKLFAEWGVESGQAAIATFGFVGVLRKLEDASHGNATEMGELFKDIRAIRGAIGLTGSSLQQYESVLDQITNDSLPKYRAATVIAFESAGKTVQTQFQRIKNFFLIDFGIPFTEALAGQAKGIDTLGGVISLLVNILGGDKGLSGAVKNIVDLIGLATKAFIAYKLSQLAVFAVTKFLIYEERIFALVMGEQAAAATNVNRSIQQVNEQLRFNRQVAVAARRAMQAIFDPTVLLTAAVTIWLWYRDQQRQAQQEIEQAYETTGQKVADQLTKETEQFAVEWDKRYQIAKTALDHEFQLELGYIANVRRTAIGLIEDQKKNVAEYSHVIRDIFDADTKLIQEEVTAIGRNAERATENAKRAAQQIEALLDSSEQRKFKFDLSNLAPVDQIARIKKQISDLQKSSADLLGFNPANVTDAAGAAKNLETAQKKSQQAEELLTNLGERRTKLEEKRKEIQERITESQARGVARDAINGQVEAEKQLEELQRKRRENASKHYVDRTLEKQITAAQEQIRLAREQEKDRRDAGKEGDYKAQLDLIDKQLASLPDRKALEGQITDLVTQQTKALEQYQKIQENLATTEKARHEDALKQFENLKTVFKEIAEFKLPKEVFDQATKSKALGDFDKLIQKAQSSGFTDQSALLELQKYRVNLAQQADLEIADHELKTQAESLQKQREQIDKFEKDVREGREQTGKAFANQFGGLSAVVAAFDKILQARGPQLGVGAQGSVADLGPDTMTQAVIAMRDSLKEIETLRNGNDKLIDLNNQLVAIQERIKTDDNPILKQKQTDIQAQIADINKILSTTNLPASFDKLQKGLAEFQRQATDTSGNPIVAVPAKDGQQAKTVTDLVNESVTMIGQLQVTFRQTAEVQKTEAALRAEQAKLGATAQAVAAQRVQLEKDLNRFGQAFIDSIRATTVSVQDLEKAVAATQARMQQLLSNPAPPVSYHASGGLIFAASGTDTIPAMLTPGEFIINAAATRKHYAELMRINYYERGGLVSEMKPYSRSSYAPSMTSISNSSVTDVGGIHITYQSSGQSSEADVRSLGQAINRGLRSGVINLRRR